MAGADAAPDEEMIEKPREPMFSKTGWMVLFGSNILIGVLIFVLVSMAGAGGGEDMAEDDGMGAEAQSTGVSIEDTWLEVDGNVAYIEGMGSERHKVSWKFAVSFDVEGQLEANNKFKQEGRMQILNSQAEELMQTYRIDEVRDGDFRSRYSRELKDRLSKLIPEYPIRRILMRTPDIR